MKKILRLGAVILVVASLAFWAAAGANRGWTKNKVQIKTGVDAVTQQDITEWKDTFIPGVDFLGKAFLGAGILAGASFLFRSKPK
jgi:hypothetical protein